MYQAAGYAGAVLADPQRPEPHNDDAPKADAAPVSRTGRALALLGDSWTLLILQRVFMGARRYQQIRDALGVSDSILADRLKTLTTGGLLVKVPYGAGRVRYEYRLTESGKETWRIFVAAWAWERRSLPGGGGWRPELVHASCGQLAAPVLVCGTCGAPVTPRDTSVRRTTDTLAYGASLPRRHQQTRTQQRRDDYCLAPATMELLGDRWNTALMAAAVIGIRRFTDFERFLAIQPAVLSARLSRFVELGMLRVQELAGPSSRTDYRLTDRGRDFADVLLELVRWADENIRSGAESSIEIRHDACGRKLQPEFACGHCAELLRRWQVRFELRDSGGPRRS